MKFKFLFFTLLVGCFFSFSSCEKDCKKYDKCVNGKFIKYEKSVDFHEIEKRAPSDMYQIVGEILVDGTPNVMYVFGNVLDDIQSCDTIDVSATTHLVWPNFEVWTDVAVRYCYEVHEMKK